MGMSSIVVEQHKFPEKVCTEDAKVITNNDPPPVRNKKFKGHMFNFYRHMLDVANSVLLIVILLALYRITGIHSWWMRLVEKIM